MSDLKWFIVIMIVLWILWVATGGTTHLENRNRPFLEEPNPINSGQAYTLEQLQDGTRP
jgi:hypothetical protein